MKCALASFALTLLTILSHTLRLNLATTSLLYVIVIILLSLVGTFASSVVASMVAAVSLVYVSPPRFSLRVDDPFDVVAIATFIITALVVARLVARLRKLAEDAISTVDRRLVEAEERQLAWTARQLHHNVHQRIALVAVNLEHLREVSGPLDPAVARQVEQIQTEISELASDIHGLSHQLHSSQLDILGLAAATKSLCKELSQKHAVEIQVSCEGIPQILPASAAATLFRVLQEALLNAVKHSGASRVQVTLKGAPSALELTVYDSGVGFDPKTALKGSGLGLVSMQERIRLVKGEFVIHSHHKGGTTLQARVPLPQQDSTVCELTFSLSGNS